MQKKIENNLDNALQHMLGFNNIPSIINVDI